MTDHQAPTPSGENPHDAPVAPVTVRKGKGGFTRNVLTLAGGAALAQVISVLSAPVLSRLVLPAAFGMAGVFNSLIRSITPLTCLGYELAIVLPKRDEDAVNLTAICGILTLCSTVLVGAVIGLVGTPLLRLLDVESLARVWYLIPLGVFLTGIVLPLRYWNSRQKHFNRLALLGLSAHLGRAVPAIILGAMGFTLGIYLVYVGALALLLPPLMLAVFWFRHDLSYALHHVRMARMREAAKRYREFPLVNTWTQFVDLASRNAPTLLLAAYFGKASAGLYGFGAAMLNMPLTLITGAVSQVFFQKAAETRANGGELGELVEGIFNRLVTLGLLPMALLMIIAPEVFALVFGQKWAAAGAYTVALTPWIFMMFTTSPLSRLFMVLEKQRMNLIIVIVLAAGRIGALVIGGYLGNVITALLLFSAASVAGICWRTWYVMRLTGARARFLAKHFGLHAMYAAPWVALLALMKWWFGLHPLILIISAAAALVPYGILALRRDDELRGVLVKALNRARSR